MRRPIIIVHRGNPRYLKYTLIQAKHYNDDVILLGDKKNAALSNMVEHHLLDDFSTSEGLTRFWRVFKHMSTTHYEFDKICFERWFHILEFLESKDIRSFFHMDSDILLYSNLSTALEKVIGNYKAAYNTSLQQYEEYRWSSSAHTSFWKTEFLREFCSFVNDSYENGINELEKKWDWHKEQSVNGGVMDMSLLYLFYLKNNNSIYNLSPVSKDNICFDNNISNSSNYKKDEYQTIQSPLNTIMKDVKFQNEKIYCYNLLNKSDVRFANLHFQGIAKYFCYRFLTTKISATDWFLSSVSFLWIYLKLKVKIVLKF
jgi:hypothetical protein